VPREQPVHAVAEIVHLMAKVDDLIKRWAKQFVLTIVARLAHGFPPTVNLLSKGITWWPPLARQSDSEKRPPDDAENQNR
jgi:hypothetical protein